MGAGRTGRVGAGHGAEYASVTDWAAVANVGTAGGTALLAVATFSSTRSANRAARSAERSLLEGLRPLLVPSRWQDPVQKVRFVDSRWLPVSGGCGVLDVTGDAVYLVMSLRNVGRGLAILDGWDVPEDREASPRDRSLFQRLTRDLSVPPDDQGFWQGAVRERTHPLFARVTAGAAAGMLPVDLLYGDSEGGQRTVSRFTFTAGPHAGARSDDPGSRGDGGGAPGGVENAGGAPGSADSGGDGGREWALSVTRHWRLDGGDFREGASSPGRLRR